jgi:hypothetical protein
LIIRRLIVPLAVALVTVHVTGFAGQALAQGAFPAPLPNGARAPANDPAFPPVKGAAPANDPAFPPVRASNPPSDPAFPPVNGAAPVRSSFPANGAAPLAGTGFGPAPAPPKQGGAPPPQCMQEFMPLRAEAEQKGKLLKAASDRHASAEDACKLIKSYGAAESKMISYIEKNSTKCGIPAEVGEQLKKGHKNTETMTQKVCGVAQQAQARGPAGPSLSDMLGTSTALPEATPTKKGGSTFDTLNGNVLSR